MFEIEATIYQMECEEVIGIKYNGQVYTIEPQIMERQNKKKKKLTVDDDFNV